MSFFFGSIKNLFEPLEILTHESALSLLRAIILIANPCVPCKQLVVTSITGPILVFPWIHPLGCDDSSAYALRAPHRLSPSSSERRTSRANTFPPEADTLLRCHIFSGPSASPQHLSVRDHGRQRSERGAQHTLTCP